MMPWSPQIIFEGYPDYYNRITGARTDGQNSRRLYTRYNSWSINTDTKIIDCWLYSLTKYRSEMRDLEKYDIYDSNGAHGKKHDVIDSEGRFLIDEEEIRRDILFWCTPEGNNT